MSLINEKKTFSDWKALNITITFIFDVTTRQTEEKRNNHDHPILEVLPLIFFGFLLLVIVLCFGAIARLWCKCNCRYCSICLRSNSSNSLPPTDHGQVNSQFQIYENSDSVSDNSPNIETADFEAVVVDGQDDYPNFPGRIPSTIDHSKTMEDLPTYEEILQDRKQETSSMQKNKNKKSVFGQIQLSVLKLSTDENANEETANSNCNLENEPRPPPYRSDS